MAQLIDMVGTGIMWQVHTADVHNSKHIGSLRSPQAKILVGLHTDQIHMLAALTLRMRQFWCVLEAASCCCAAQSAHVRTHRTGTTGSPRYQTTNMYERMATFPCAAITTTSCTSPVTALQAVPQLFASGTPMSDTCLPALVTECTMRWANPSTKVIVSTLCLHTRLCADCGRSSH